MRTLRRYLAREDGIALVTVVMMIGVMTLLSIVLIDQVTAESNSAGRSVKSDAVYQAAESGINDYMAKLVDDPQFYDHFVANGESTRQVCTSFNGPNCTALGAVAGPGSTWTSGSGWVYPNGKDTWYPGIASSSIDGYAYDLMIAPPSTVNTRDYVTVVSTGCKLLDPSATPIACDPAVPNRAIEVHLKTTTPADFSFMYARTPTQWGSGATTYGKIYVSGSTYKDAQNHTIVDPGDICHDGTAYGDLMAEGRVNRTGCYNASNTPPTNGGAWPTTGNGSTPTVTYATPSGGSKAIKYDSLTTPKPSCPAGSNPPCPLKSATDFSNFATSLTDIKNSSDQNTPTTDFNATGAVWRIMFYPGSGPNGTVTVWKCTSASSQASNYTNALTAPTGCNSTSAYSGPLPKNGAIYTQQDAVIYAPSTTSAIVNGHVTIASANDIVIGTNIHYQQEYGGANDDVLGLIAQRNIWIAQFAPNTLFWRAAVIAETGMESVYDCTYPPSGTAGHSPPFRGSSSSMTIVGSIADATGDGCAARGSDSNLSGGYNTRVYASDDGNYLSSFNALKFLFPPWYPVIDTQTTIYYREVPSSYVLTNSN
jgi:Tfp pilus assembly protein PilX